MEHLPHEQYETEMLLFTALNNGDKSKLAKQMGTSLANVSRRLNPNDLRQSEFFRFRRFLTALAGINQQAARLLLGDLHTVVETPERCGKDIQEVAGEVLRESADLVCARLAKLPAHVQKKEALEVRAVVDRFIAKLDCEIQRKGSEVALPNRHVNAIRRRA